MGEVFDPANSLGTARVRSESFTSVHVVCCVRKMTSAPEWDIEKRQGLVKQKQNPGFNF